MAIVVLRELRKELSTDLGPGDAVSRIAAVHAATAEPDALGDVGDRTFCGKPTLDMERVDYQPPEPGASWLPPNMRPWECSSCTDALRSL
ncbi:hypothetical protein G9272_00985 [Streptomyces asoensis]|uniref:Uncharacterized protein n=1 Tax=Streptomyces asoensis TaxID=249586 RepID=A0A6M4WGW9_9ACTN|nr:hypothetical protein [Streptomyces asoensis]QJS99081.1 hypothetical protein G9272_00985 [Streptomyces asoensis]